MQKWSRKTMSIFGLVSLIGSGHCAHFYGAWTPGQGTAVMTVHPGNTAGPALSSGPLVNVSDWDSRQLDSLAEDPLYDNANPVYVVIENQTGRDIRLSASDFILQIGGQVQTPIFVPQPTVQPVSHVPVLPSDAPPHRLDESAGSSSNSFGAMPASWNAGSSDFGVTTVQFRSAPRYVAPPRAVVGAPRYVAPPAPRWGAAPRYAQRAPVYARPPRYTTWQHGRYWSFVTPGLVVGANPWWWGAWGWPYNAYAYYGPTWSPSRALSVEEGMQITALPTMMLAPGQRAAGFLFFPKIAYPDRTPGQIVWSVPLADNQARLQVSASVVFQNREAP